MHASASPEHASVRNTGLQQRLASGGAERRRYVTALIMKRVSVVPVAMFGVVSLSFLLVSAIPSDPARTALGDFATKTAVATFNHQFGLDRSLWQRYISYLTNLVHGNLGQSYYGGPSVAHQIVLYLPPTVELVTLSLIVAVGLGTAVGLVGAYSRRAPVRGVARLWTGITQAVPDFALGLVLIYLLFFRLHLAPAPLGQFGTGDPRAFQMTNALAFDAFVHLKMTAFVTCLKYLIMPVATLGLVYSAIFARMALALLDKAFASAQVEFARACGLSERQVIRYAFHEVRAPLITYVAILFGFLIGGEAVVETVFAWNGLGQWALTAVLKLDLPVVEGFILVAGAIVLVTYVLLDVISLLLDPRIAAGAAS